MGHHQVTSKPALSDSESVVNVSMRQMLDGI
jgi:hypothetical protein